MLARRNRIVEADDFRRVVRRGEKVVTAGLVGYRIPSDGCRIGIIVTAKSGNAVVRNTIRRRTRAITNSFIANGELSGDVVFRFRGETEQLDFAAIETGIQQCVDGWRSA